jgi:hypothetical protein
VPSSINSCSSTPRQSHGCTTFFLSFFPKYSSLIFSSHFHKPGSLPPWPPSSASREWTALLRACLMHYDKAGTRWRDASKGTKIQT